MRGDGGHDPCSDGIYILDAGETDKLHKQMSITSDGARMLFPIVQVRDGGSLLPGGDSEDGEQWFDPE